ncbi:sensor histidine kinase [Dermacoccaceae bacterium W4C1]
MSEHHPWRGPVSDALHEVPLRVRLVAVTVGLLVTALGVAGLAASYRLQDYVEQQKSSELHAAAPNVLERVEQSLPDSTPGATAATYGGYAIAIMPRGQKVSFTSDQLPDLPGINPDHPYATSHRAFVVRSRDGDTRWLAAAYTTGDNSTAVVAVSLASADETVERMRWYTVFSSLVAAIVSAILGWFLIRRAFRPLSAIEDTAKAIADGDLTRRVPDTTTQDEVASLAISLNIMLARIEESFAMRSASEERMRRFVADASHELRTPLATVRGYAELYRQGAIPDREAMDSTMVRIEGEAVRMSALVDDLLLLTRLDRRAAEPDSRPLRPEPVDLTVIGAEAVDAARVRDRERSIRLLGLSGPVGPTIVLGDEAQLRQVLTNLLTNALRYSPAGTPVEVLVGTEGPAAVLAVRDHGPGIPESERGRIFERFYRADPSRNTALGGSGLGLAIVQAIVTGHQGSVTVTDTEGGGATVLVHFPQVEHRDEQDGIQPDPMK